MTGLNSEDMKNTNGFQDVFTKNVPTKNGNIFLSSAIKFVTIPWKRQNMKTKVGNKAVIAK